MSAVGQLVTDYRPYANLNSLFTPCDIPSAWRKSIADAPTNWSASSVDCMMGHWSNWQCTRKDASSFFCVVSAPLQFQSMTSSPMWTYWLFERPLSSLRPAILCFIFHLFGCGKSVAIGRMKSIDDEKQQVLTVWQFLHRHQIAHLCNM